MKAAGLTSEAGITLALSRSISSDLTTTYWFVVSIWTSSSLSLSCAFTLDFMFYDYN